MSAPFSDYSWAYAWDRTSNPSDPVLDRYLDTQTGWIGSAIETRVNGADNYDAVYVEYYTGMNIWHTPLSTGPLEVYVAFEFNTSTYSGKISDEWGFSGILYTHGASATLLAADAVDPVQRETAQSPIYGFTDYVWGEDHWWANQVASPRDRHWYFFRTGATFQQGSSVLLEAGIRHRVWFETNDESISMSADLNLRLDSILVRSCEGPIIL